MSRQFQQRLLTSDHLSFKGLRFAMVGVVAGALYVCVTTALVTMGNVQPVVASIIGYAASMPAGLVGHRQFSFRSSGHWFDETVRFVAIQLFNIALTAVVMHGVISWVGGTYWWGMIAAMILIPISNFTLTNLWVFRNQVMA